MRPLTGMEFAVLSAHMLGKDEWRWKVPTPPSVWVGRAGCLHSSRGDWWNSENVNLDSMVLSAPFCPCQLHGLHASSATNHSLFWDLGLHLVRCWPWGWFAWNLAKRMLPGPSLSPSVPHSMPPSLVSEWHGRKSIHVCPQCFLTILEGWEGSEFVWLQFNPLVPGCPTSAGFVLHGKCFAHLFTLRSRDLPNISGSPSCPMLACPWCSWCYWVWSAKAWLSRWWLLSFI